MKIFKNYMKNKETQWMIRWTQWSSTEQIKQDY